MTRSRPSLLVEDTADRSGPAGPWVDRVLAGLAPRLRRAGLDPAACRCRVESAAGRTLLTLDVGAPVDARTAQVLSVRALALLGDAPRPGVPRLDVVVTPRRPAQRAVTGHGAPPRS